MPAIYRRRKTECLMRKDEQFKEWSEMIGRRIRAHRKSAGLSLEQLSLLSGAAVPTLSIVERGKRDVKLSTLVSLADALRIDLPDLFTVNGTEDPLLGSAKGAEGRDKEND